MSYASHFRKKFENFHKAEIRQGLCKSVTFKKDVYNSFNQETIDMADVDEGFFNRADEHIHLSNNQMLTVSMGKVSASMLYSVARFNAYVSASEWKKVQEMKDARQATIEFFVAEYQKMLEENVDDYIKHFDRYKG